MLSQFKFSSGQSPSSYKKSRGYKSPYLYIKNLYLYLARKFANEGVNSIRIDVVNDYETNVIPFWKALGFLGQKETFLTWGEKTSRVLVMTKSLLKKENIFK